MLYYNHHDVGAFTIESVQIKAEQLIAEVVPVLQELFKKAAQAGWDASCESSDAHEQAAEDAQNAVDLYLSNPDVFAALRTLRKDPSLEPDTAREVESLYLMFAGNQFSEDEIRQLNALQTKVQSLFHRHRAVVGGEEVSDNALHDILADSTDSTSVQEAWLASKTIGRVTAEPIRELARLRNTLAQKRGYLNYQDMALQLQEIDATWLFTVLDGLRAQTDAPFAAVKARLDAQLAERFSISEDELMPWHYGNPFFQEVPSVAGVDITPHLAGQDIVATAQRFYDDLGLDVQGILARSDLYEREAKNQHAFCTDIDRQGDVRILCNVRPNGYWLNTMLHELGHAVYDVYLPDSLPYLLHTCPDMASTEAIALLLEGVASDPAWLAAYVGLRDEEAESQRAALQYQRALGKLIFVRWGLVMVYFERELYRDPEQDLNALWWELVSDLQGLRKPEGRDEPDYAAKYHIGCAPVYYHNYILGHMIADQLREVILTATGTTTFARNRGAGQWLREQYFAPGNIFAMPELVRESTGMPLSGDAFARAVTLS